MLNTKKTLQPHRATDYLIEHVLEIIDTRIQYLEYQDTKMLNQCISQGNQREGQVEGTLIRQFDFLLEHAHQSARKLKYLILMRTHLLRGNAKLILDLLSNNRYLEITEDRLRYILKPGTFS